MLTWEQQTIRIKTDFDLTKAYFKAIVKATDVYEQNIGGGSTRGNNFESANQMADIGDELREWIQQIATTSANKEQAANTQATEKISSMEVQIMKLTATIPQMAANMNNENINPNTSSGDRESWRPQVKKEHNMGAYNQSHRFHPVGINHISATCSWKKVGHKDEATSTNRMGGDTFWPTAKRVAINQQNHATWKGKSASSNWQGPGEHNTKEQQ